MYLSIGSSISSIIVSNYVYVYVCHLGTAPSGKASLARMSEL